MNDGIVKRVVFSINVKLAEQPYDVIPDATVYDLLYSQDSNNLKQFLKQGGEADTARLLSKTKEDWIDLLNQTLSENQPKVLLLGYPNATYSKLILADETKRIEEQIAELGPKGLQDAAVNVEDAIDSQVFPPNEVLESIPTANVTSILYRKLTYHNFTNSGGWGKGQSFMNSQDDKIVKKFDIKSIPFHFHFDDLNSQFVRFYLFIDMSSLSQEDKMYAVLLMQH